MTYLLVFLGGLIAARCAWSVWERVPKLLRARGLVRPNFRGHEVPVGAGVHLLLCLVPAYAAASVLLPELHPELPAYLTLLLGFGLLGLLDDARGDRSASGLGGHLRALLMRRQITTGLAKAVLGLMLCWYVARWMLGLPRLDALAASLTIALSANTLNLLDVRPGRAGAFAFVCAGLISLLAWTNHAQTVSGPLLAALWALVPLYLADRRGEAMMGDAGSNLLGALVGLAWVLWRPWPSSLWCAVAALALLHAVAERWSLTALIERVPPLRVLDRLTGVR